MINIKHKANRKSKKIQIKNMPMFLLIGLIALIIIILLIYFLFLYYSPEMVLRYSGYAIESKTMVENLKNEDIETVQKYINLVDVQEQTIIYKKFNSYYVGDSKEEIDINYPIYLNDGNVLLNLSDITKLITVNYEEVEGYPDFMLTGGIMYNGDDLTRADGNEYLFWKTDDNIYINAVKIQIKTSYNTYEISEYSNINFSEDYIAYYEQEDNYLEYHKIGDIDNKSIISLNNQEITYKDLLERLGIIATEDEKETNENELVEENMVENEVIDHESYRQVFADCIYKLGPRRVSAKANIELSKNQDLFSASDSEGNRFKLDETLYILIPSTTKDAMKILRIIAIRLNEKIRVNILPMSNR